MPNMMTVETLREELSKSDNIVILDVRFDLQDEQAGRRAYERDHIPGAYYIDLKKDLASPAQVHGGENPLPNPDQLAEKLGKLGIDEKTKVLIYDEDNKIFAARAWWTLYYIGLEHLYILDGGYKRWKDKGFEVTGKIPTAKKKDLKAKVRENLFVTIEEVKDKLQDGETILIDSRAPSRYRGDEEPLYRKAGHIPGAINYHYINVYKEDGTFKDKKQLKEVFSSLPKDKELIISCGSGVSACSNVIGLKLAGFKKVKLYPGSFSDWISYEENEVVKSLE